MKTLKERVYSNLETMTIEEYQKYVNEVDLNYIRMRKHPEDENIVILNYTDLTTWERRWNNETMTSRGLILDLTEAKDNGIIYILAKPFDKFFNYGENLDYEKDIDFSTVEYVTEKMDGSLGISYFFNNEIRFATRGSFTSDQAIKATQIWFDKYSRNFPMDGYPQSPYTILVEIIYPENRIVVNYGQEEELVMLGVRSVGNNVLSVDEVDYDILEDFGERLGMRVAPKNDFTIEAMMEMRKSISANEEGWILKFTNNKRLKIKGDEYCQVHRIKHGMSTKAKYLAWSEDRLQEYIMQLPEEFRDELEEFEKQLNVWKDSQKLFLTLLFQDAKIFTTDRKEFAEYVKKEVDKEYHKHMFKAYQNGAISEDMIRYDIYKDYEKYEELITWKSV